MNRYLALVLLSFAIYPISAQEKILLIDISGSMTPHFRTVLPLLKHQYREDLKANREVRVILFRQSRSSLRNVVVKTVEEFDNLLEVIEFGSKTNFKDAFSYLFQEILSNYRRYPQQKSLQVDIYTDGVGEFIGNGAFSTFSSSLKKLERDISLQIYIHNFGPYSLKLYEVVKKYLEMSQENCKVVVSNQISLAMPEREFQAEREQWQMANLHLKEELKKARSYANAQQGILQSYYLISAVLIFLVIVGAIFVYRAWRNNTSQIQNVAQWKAIVDNQQETIDTLKKELGYSKRQVKV